MTLHNVLQLASFLALLGLAFYFYVLGKRSGVSKARFIMWAQLYCQQDWRAGRDIIQGFNDLILSQPGAYGEGTHIGYGTGYVWLRLMTDAKMLQSVCVEDADGRLRLFRTMQPKLVEQKEPAV